MANNSMIVADLSNCWTCSRDIDVYCYSNSTFSNVGYVVTKCGGKIYNAIVNYGVNVSRVNPSGIQIKIYNYSSSYYDCFGMFTCELPDSEGNTLEASFGVYPDFFNSSMRKSHVL